MSVKTYSLAKDGDKQLTENFKVREFRCKDGSDKILIDDNLPKLLQTIRDAFGKPITINSAYRTPAYNKKVGGAVLVPARSGEGGGYRRAGHPTFRGSGMDGTVHPQCRKICLRVLSDQLIQSCGREIGGDTI